MIYPVRRVRGALAAFGILAMSLASVRGVLAQAPFTFYRVQTLVDAASFGDVSWVDLDGDLDQDLLIVASTGVGSRVPTTAVFDLVGTTMTMTDDGVPSPSADYRRESVAGAVDLWLSDIDWADYDLDGDLDAVVAGTSQSGEPWSPVVQFYENSGSGTLTARPGDGIVPTLGVVRWADVDNDGDSDLLVMGRTAAGQAVTRMYENRGGAFQPIEVGLPDVAFGDAAWTDVDRDGDLDVAICGSLADGTHETSVFLNQGFGTFTELALDAVGLVFCSLEWGDFDQDGFPDLLTSGGRTSALVLGGTTRVYRNVNGTALEEQPFDLEGVVGGSARWIDVDNDGALDIMTSGGRDLVLGKAIARIYRNDGNQFRLVSNISGTFPGRMELGDFDRDGDLDLVMVGPDRGGLAITYVFLNAELVANTAPSEPSDLQSQVTGGSARLGWSPAADEETDMEGLTYNLRVGTANGSGDVMSVPVAIDGRPTRSSAGNVGHNTSWTIRGLPNGTYYWNVQAVDNSYTTSAFSASASFDVTASSGIKPVSDEAVSGAPGSLHLSAPHPNPLRFIATMEYELPRSAPVQLEIYDMLGRRLHTLVDDVQSAGRHTQSWDGRDSSGQWLASGIYVIRLSAAGEARLATIALLR